MPNSTARYAAVFWLRAMAKAASRHQRSRSNRCTSSALAVRSPEVRSRQHERRPEQQSKKRAIGTNRIRRDRIMPNIMLHDDDARQALGRGIAKLAKAV